MEPRGTNWTDLRAMEPAVQTGLLVRVSEIRKLLRRQFLSCHEALIAECRSIIFCIRMEGKSRRKSLCSYRLDCIDESYLLSLSQSIIPRENMSLRNSPESDLMFVLAPVSVRVSVT